MMQRMDPSRRRWRPAALAAVLLAGTTLGGFAGLALAETGPAPVAAPINTAKQAAMPERLPSFTHLVAEVKPAVVSVTN